jgi:putative ABC transport system permease protein
MITHALRQIFRSLWRYKSFTFINILGLAIGIAAVTLIFLIANYEKSFDQLSKNSKDIYRVVRKSQKGGTAEYSGAVPYPTAKFLRNEMPGVVASQIHYVNDVNIRIGNKTPFNETAVMFADSMFLDVFDFGNIEKFVVAGDARRALSAPGKAIITEGTAKRYFGNTNAIGQTVRLDARLDVEVAAVIKDIPSTTHLPFKLLVSYASLTKDFIAGFNLDQWGFVSNGYCYVRATDKAAPSEIERSLYAIVQKNAESDRDKREKYFLQPLSKIHFDPAFESSNPSYTVSPKYLTMLMLLGCFIIFIACINYINLSTSLAFSKSKEVGIRKTIGASKFQLFVYYLCETLVLTTIAAMIGFVIASLLVPAINGLLDKSIPVELLTSLRFIIGAIAGLIVVSFISGVYPALIMSGFKPIESLKNQLSMPTKSSTILRKSLVVFQFSTSIALIICTIIIARQMHYSHTKSLGFNKDAVVEIGLPSPDSTKIEAFRSLIQNQAGIQQISFCLGAPISDNGISTSLRAPELRRMAITA